MKQLLFTLSLLISSIVFGVAQPVVSNYVPGDILIQLEQNMNPERWVRQNQILNGLPIQIKLHEKINEHLNISLIQFDAQMHNEVRVLRAIQQSAGVVNAQFNHYITNRSTEPNDPKFNDQWQYKNTGQSGGTIGADIDADLAWDITTGGLTSDGDTIVVCVVDGGFDITHEDMKGNVWYNHAEIPNNGIDDDNNGFIDDYKGWNAYSDNDEISAGGNTSHGTPCIGIVGAKGNNGVGVAGVNWNVKVMCVAGSSGTESTVLKAYSYPLAFRKLYNETNGEKGAFVVATSSSWGVDGGNPDSAPLWCAFYDTLGQYGILNVAATINGNQNVDEFGDLPTACSSDFLIAVTNMDHNDVKVQNAGYGATTIDLGAFGAGTYTITSNNGYGGFGGTSAATPHVAGTIGLLYSMPCSNFMELAKSQPREAAAKIKDFIMNGGDDNESLANITVSGKRLNMLGALSLMEEDCSNCPSVSGTKIVSEDDQSANVSWNTSDDVLSVNLIYKTKASSTWDTLYNVKSPYVLNNLKGCTEYELSLHTVCDTITNFSKKITSFITEGCCTNPDFSFENVTENSCNITWNSIYAADSYVLRYKEDQGTEWSEIETKDLTTMLTALKSCTYYDVQIKILCGDTYTDYSALQRLLTKGCGACIEAEYCIPKGLITQYEFIDRIKLNDLDSESGNNNGYIDYELERTTELGTNKTYDFIIQAGYSGSDYQEKVSVFLDSNQNGIFEDNERLLDKEFKKLDTFALTIPDDAKVGLSKLRVFLTFHTLNDVCKGSDQSKYGECEDYCVYIVDEKGCIPPNIINLTEKTLSSLDLEWPKVTGATGYKLIWKHVSASVWDTIVSDGNTYSLEGLEKCTKYVFTVQSICQNEFSINSELFAFKTKCETGVQVESLPTVSVKIFPNPTASAVEVKIMSETNQYLNVTLNHIDGRVLKRWNDVKCSNEKSIYIDMHDYSSGVYLLKLDGVATQTTVKKIVKL